MLRLVLSFQEFTNFQEDFYAKMQAGTMPTAENKQLFKWGKNWKLMPFGRDSWLHNKGLSVYLNVIERIIFKPLQGE